MKTREHDDDLPLDPLDRGLRAGFGDPRKGSVIACLEGRTGSMLRLILPDADDDREPVVKPVGPEGAAGLGSRYQVLGEVARGGLGVVLKGRDLDLGRDVAVKVLHERFKGDRSVIERFVEEAQIGGQLQHPGIVPVYELGLRPDERPFFAMKLVKGETLAALLGKRRAPAHDLQRFLRVFQQICQTIAYAHARRVVHRDLKPSNVLVGAFGEVQVVDWGFAKVLRSGGVADEPAVSGERDDVSVIETIRSSAGSTHSIAGSVMGTPAYMPPEQARGDVEQMDPCSDVFSLGAVLCEILTGRPPYDERDPLAAMRAASACHQEPAQRRLDECGAEPDLVELTRACLAPSRDARPLDAGEVARRVEEHLQSTEERARRAEVRAAELRVRTRSLLTLAGVITTALAVSTWAYLAWTTQLRDRRLETARRAESALAEGRGYVEQARRAGLGGVGLWQSALTAATRAEAIVAAGEAEAELEERVSALVEDATRGESRTRAEALKEESHELLLERLVEARVGPDVPRMDLFEGPARRERESTRRVAEYAGLFRELGVDEDTTPDEIAALVDCAHQSRFALALDARAEAERVAATFDDDPDPESWRRWVRAARRIDPDDPWRNALRDELSREELDARGLRALAADESLRGRTAEELAVLVALLDAAGDAEAAIETQMEAMLLHPSDFWLNLSFGSLVAQEELTGRLHGTTAIWATRAALVLRPESRAARFGSLVHVEDDDASEALLLELRREDPDDPLTEAMHFMAVMEAGRFDEARAMLPDALPALQSLRLDWDYAPFLVALGLGERLFETPGVPPVKLGLLHLVLGRADEAWPILSAHRDELRPGWPWLYLPTVLRDARSADDLRATMERLSSLPTADEATLRETPTDELLAATDLCHPVDCVRLFQQAFENDPASKERWHLATARQIAAFTAAGASGMAVDEQSPDERAALRDQALAWMHEELDVIEERLARPGLARETAVNISRSLNQMTFYGWLAPIRERAYLDEMTPEQAHACRLLWARIAGLEAMLVDLATQ